MRIQRGMVLTSLRHVDPEVLGVLEVASDQHDLLLVGLLCLGCAVHRFELKRAKERLKLFLKFNFK